MLQIAFTYADGRVDSERGEGGCAGCTQLTIMFFAECPLYFGGLASAADIMSFI